MSKLLLAPLNWGLGHASRCIPLVQRFLDEGHEVVIGGDGESFTLLRKHFPKLRYVYLAPLKLRYSKGSRQVWAMLRALPQLISWSVKDHTLLQAILREEHFDCIISDNRFGLFLSNRRSRSNSETVQQCNGLTGENREALIVPSGKEAGQTHSVYITHQLHIMLPKGWRWAEPIAERLHARIYSRFNEVWVPDYEDPSLSLAGDLSHLKNQKSKIKNLKYIGPLSRFEIVKSSNLQIFKSSNLQFDIVAVLSGLEPHRTLLEQQLIARYSGKEDRVLIVQGLMHRPNTRITRSNITIVPWLSDDELVPALLGARHIIARSGYSTIMDLHALGLLNHNSKIINHKSQISNLKSQIDLIPTPGQPEQEYLALML